MKSTYISTQKESDPNEYGMGNQSGSQNRVVYQYKVILLGDISVGKTSILRRFIEDEFTSEYYCTVGVEFRIKTIYLNNNLGADLKIWDTCGEEKYRTITRQYYRDSNGVLLVFDLTSAVSFEKLQEWYDDVVNNGPKDLHIVLIGNKKDLPDKEVTPDMVKQFLDEHNDIEYIETSALSGEGVGEAFKILANKLTKWTVERESKRPNVEYKRKEPEFISSKTHTLSEPVAKGNSEENKKKKCC